MKGRAKPKLPVAAGDILGDLFARPLTFEGKRMSTREAMIRGLYKHSLAGDVNAALELQKLRDACGVECDAKPAGYLVLPEMLSVEEWERLAYEQQAQFREKDYGKSEL